MSEYDSILTTISKGWRYEDVVFTRIMLISFADVVVVGVFVVS